MSHLLTWFVRWAARRFGGGESIRRTLGICSTVAGGAWFVCFLMVVLPRCEFSINQLVVALFWGLTPVFASVGFAWGWKEARPRTLWNAGLSAAR